MKKRKRISLFVLGASVFMLSSCTYAGINIPTDILSTSLPVDVDPAISTTKDVTPTTTKDITPTTTKDIVPTTTKDVIPTTSTSQEHVHQFVHHAEIPMNMDTMDFGTIEYYSCSTCNENYLDEDGDQQVFDLVNRWFTTKSYYDEEHTNLKEESRYEVGVDKKIYIRQATQYDENGVKISTLQDNYVYDEKETETIMTIHTEKYYDDSIVTEIIDTDYHYKNNVLYYSVVFIKNPETKEVVYTTCYYYAEDGKTIEIYTTEERTETGFIYTKYENDEKVLYVEYLTDTEGVSSVSKEIEYTSGKKVSQSSYSHDDYGYTITTEYYDDDENVVPEKMVISRYDSHSIMQWIKRIKDGKYETTEYTYFPEGEISQIHILVKDSSDTLLLENYISYSSEDHATISSNIIFRYSSTGKKKESYFASGYSFTYFDNKDLKYRYEEYKTNNFLCQITDFTYDSEDKMNKEYSTYYDENGTHHTYEISYENEKMTDGLIVYYDQDGNYDSKEILHYVYYSDGTSTFSKKFYNGTNIAADGTYSINADGQAYYAKILNYNADGVFSYSEEYIYTYQNSTYWSTIVITARNAMDKKLSVTTATCSEDYIITKDKIFYDSDENPAQRKIYVNEVLTEEYVWSTTESDWIPVE